VYLESTSSSEENVTGGNTRIVYRLIVEPQGYWTPWRRDYAEEAQRDKIVKDSVELCQEGIE
jgi:hypothetical protein